MADRTAGRRRVIGRRLAVVLLMATLGMALAPPASADLGAVPPPEVRGELNSQGLGIAARIARDNEPSTSSPPPPYRWVFREWILQPGNCDPGQTDYQAWRIDNATGWVLRFYRLTSDGSGRDPEFEENSPINPTVYDTALEVWFTHVCYGPPLPDVEAALYEALPDPEVGVSPRAGIRGDNRDGHLDLVPAELNVWSRPRADHRVSGDRPG